LTEKFQISEDKYMSEKQRFFYVDGKAVPVSEEVYQTYWHYERKERYAVHDLKISRRVCDRETRKMSYVPGREISYEDLSEEEKELAASGPSMEEQVIDSVWLQDLMQGLTEQERQIIHQLYVLGKTERKSCAAMGLNLSTFQRHRDALLKKLREILQKNF